MNTEFKKILVTGGTGFIGKYFLDQLIASNSKLDVYVGQSSISKINNDSSKNFTSIHLNLFDPIIIKQNFDIIFHIASEKNNTQNMWEVNLDGTRRLLEWAIDHGVKRFVYLSSVGVYGAAKNTGVVSIGTTKLAKGIYEESKSSAEDLVIEKCITNNIEYVILQPSNVVGWAFGKSYPLLGLMRSVKRRLFTYFGNMRSYVNYVTVEDVASALVSSTKPKAQNNIFIINSPVFLDQLIGWISQEMSLPIPTRRLPMILGEFSANLADQLNEIPSISIPFGKERYNEITNTTVYDGLAINEKINFSYTYGIEAGIRRLTRIYITEGLL
jgi:nucleoside-diphosphate-sugar epimerase